MTQLDCHMNQFKGETMDALIENLPTVSEGKMYVIYCENEQNVMTVTQVVAAKAKGWTPYYCTGFDDEGYDVWAEYEESNAPTSIESLTPATSPRGEGSIYTLDGRKLGTKPTQRGIYIVNGKKVLK